MQPEQLATKHKVNNDDKKKDDQIGISSGSNQRRFPMRYTTKLALH